MVKMNKNPELGNWVKGQRSLYTKNRLLSNRKFLLESIGFTWTLQVKIKRNTRESMIQLLLEYKAKNFHTMTPIFYSKAPQLGKWVRTQRQFHANRLLPSSHALQLGSAGFVWWVDQKKWESMIKLLLEYKSKHGNTMVPTKYAKMLPLGKLVQTQRYLYWKKKLPSHCILNLESIDFVWCLGKRRWDSMFQMLRQSKDQHSFKAIQFTHRSNPQLRRWAENQKHLYSKKQLSNRVTYLESVGFVWSMQRWTV